MEYFKHGLIFGMLYVVCHPSHWLNIDGFISGCWGMFIKVIWTINWINCIIYNRKKIMIEHDDYYPCTIQSKSVVNENSYCIVCILLIQGDVNKWQNVDSIGEMEILVVHNLIPPEQTKITLSGTVVTIKYNIDIVLSSQLYHLVWPLTPQLLRPPFVTPYPEVHQPVCAVVPWFFRFFVVCLSALCGFFCV